MHRRGCQSDDDSRHERDAERPTEDAEIEAHFIQTRQVVRAEGTNEANGDDREQCAKQSRDDGEQGPLGE